MLQRRSLETQHAPKGQAHHPLSASIDEIARQWTVKRLLFDQNQNIHLASHRSHGGTSIFWRFPLNSLSMTRAPVSVRKEHPEHEQLSSHIVSKGRKLSLSMPASPREKIKNATLEYCLLNPKKTIDIHAAGAQNSSDIPEHLYCRDKKPLCTSENSECIRASILNCIGFYDRSEALEILSSGTLLDERLGSVSNWLREKKTRFTLNHCLVGTNRNY